MKALRYDFSIPNYVATLAVGKLPGGLLERGRIPGLSLVDAAPRPLPGPEWLRARPLLSGICGSDISLLVGKSGPALSPFTSFPAVLGHEVLAEVVETGPGVTGLRPGQRFVLNPTISCDMRGLPACPACAADTPGLCTNAAEGSIAPGLMTGFCRDLPGGWSEDLILHRDQVVPIPDDIADETAVLLEPFAVAVHAALRNPPPPEARVLLIGAGTIGLLTLAALRMIGVTADITVLARHPVQERLATAFGATRVLTRGSADQAAVDHAGARRYKPIKGGPTMAGGFDWIYDCVGSQRSVMDSMRVAGPRGEIVLVGCAGEIAHLDLTFVWSRELTITGCYIYGPESSYVGSPNTFDVAIDLIRQRRDIRLSDLVTHRFPLTRWQDAIGATLARGSHGAVKVVFDCRDADRP
jgi:threonine dehydrogenase-like Zn-dependent dehydrogenase